MTEEMQTAVTRLQTLPEEVQADIAPKLNSYLNKLEDLRAAIQEGIDSGPAIPGDEVFDRLEAKYRRMAEEQQA